MSDDKSDGRPARPMDERQQRLAAALRANLRRRKAQERARGDAPPFPDDPPSARTDGDD